MKASGGDAGWSKAKKRHMRMGRSAAVGSAGNIMEAAPFFNFFLFCLRRIHAFCLGFVCLDIVFRC